MLPKKYAKMGFKAGWKAYKKLKSTRKPKKNTYKKTIRRVQTVARKKRYSRKKTQSKGMFETALSRMGKPIGSMAYGAIRSRISNAVANTEFGKKLPVTNYTDEAVMLGISYLARKSGLAKNGIMRRIVGNGESIEWARIGEQLSFDLMKKQQIGTTATNQVYPV